MNHWKTIAAVCLVVLGMVPWCGGQTAEEEVAAETPEEELPPPVPEGVAVVVGTVGTGRRAVRPGRGGAVSVGVGTDAGRGETVVWDATGRVQWRGRTELPRKCPAAVRTPVGVVAWNGAEVAVRPREWEEAGVVDAEVFAWVLEGDGPQFARLSGEAIGRGTNAACFDAEFTGGWWVLHWDAWSNAPAGTRLYAVVPKGDADGDGLSDGRETLLWHTDPVRCDTDGDTRGDGLETVLGSDPHQPHMDARITVNALWTDPAGSGGSWVELYSSAPGRIPLEGFRLETAKDGVWRTVLAFPSGLLLEPGRCLLVGEKNVPDADLHADLDFPARWPWKPESGARIVWDGAPCGAVADAVIVGRADFPESGGLGREGWESHAGVRPKDDEPLVRHFPGVDNNRSRDWTTRTGYAARPSATVPDTDGDGLPDADEWSGRLNRPWGEPTNPHNADSDGDGLGDGDECNVYHTNPNSWASDDDIYPWIPQGTPVHEWPGSDPYELEHGWNPLVADENANGIPDSWEMVFGTGNLLGGADSNGNGIPDLHELRSNRNPRP